MPKKACAYLTTLSGPHYLAKVTGSHLRCKSATALQFRDVPNAVPGESRQRNKAEIVKLYRLTLPDEEPPRFRDSTDTLAASNSSCWDFRASMLSTSATNRAAITVKRTCYSKR